jgi:hypothetical protein
MPIELLQEVKTEEITKTTYKTNTKRLKRPKTARKSIKLFGHKYYIRPHALQIYEYITCTALIILMYFALYLCYLTAYK